ncbi:hypothetical protein ACWV26_03535 [Rummeliibacillus sp. JY-2-4R]
MGYILPISDFQTIQYMNQSLQKKRKYSFINKIEEIKKQSNFGRELVQRHQQSKSKYCNRQKIQQVYDKSLTLYDLNIAELTSKGLKYDFCI